MYIVYMLPMAVAWSSSDKSALRYILLILRDDVMCSHNGLNDGMVLLQQPCYNVRHV